MRVATFFGALATASAAWCGASIPRLAFTVELRPLGLGFGEAVLALGGRPIARGGYVQGEDGAIAWSREFTIVNFPEVRINEAWSRELSLAQTSRDPDPTPNAWSREITLVQSPEATIAAAWSRELTLHNPAADEPVTNAWSRELTLGQTPGYVVYQGWSREVTLNNRATSDSPNAWGREATVGNLYLPAIGILAEKGRIVSGLVGDLGERDGREVVVRADGPRTTPAESEIADTDLIRLRIEGQSNVQTPSRIDVVLFGRASVGRIDQIVELYDWLNLAVRGGLPRAGIDQQLGDAGPGFERGRKVRQRQRPGDPGEGQVRPSSGRPSSEGWDGTDELGSGGVRDLQIADSGAVSRPTTPLQ